MSAPPLEVLRSGLAPPGRLEELEAGPLRVLFDRESGSLRSIYCGGAEVLRGISAPVRDRNWGTVAPVVENLRIQRGKQRFRVDFRVICRRDDIDFQWRAAIVGTAAGQIRFTFDGRARGRFLKNRIGFCILHPSEICAGLPCRVRSTSGETREGVFPKLVSPHQPFFDMSAIEHPISNGLWARVEMSGDTFEMEDQRNWSDASYKTYCTPLARLFPVEMRPGDRIRQEVLLTLIGERRALPGPRVAGQVEVTVKDESHPLPALGLGFNPDAPPLTESHVQRLRGLRLAHIRVDALPSRDDFASRLSKARALAKAIGAQLEIGLLLTDDYRAELEAARKLKFEAARWLLLPAAGPASAPEWAEAARGLPGSIGGGTNAFFAELNRNRPGQWDEICWPLNPQVHAFDNRSLAENLLALPDMVAAARSFAGGARLAVSPVTLKMRFNPNATVASERAPLGYRESQVDARQMSLFGAGWTLGCIAAHAAAGVSSLTLYETHGPTGIQGPVEQPEWFPVKDAGAVFPVYRLLAGLAPYAGGRVQPAVVSDPLAVAAMCLTSPREQCLILANLTAGAQTIRIPRGGGMFWRLDESYPWQIAHAHSVGAHGLPPGHEPPRETTLPPYSLEVRRWPAG
ncbi:MAG: hypothetical protein KJZ84_24730 [Bryobacteraceae bacterium]|nr:hypothetical protein [Bryobacteraceae bacterium]